MSVHINSSIIYTEEVKKWIEKLDGIMVKEKYAPIAILAYYLPRQHTMIGCPLGDAEFKAIGEEMRVNPALFAAAEKTGLIAEGVSCLFKSAIDNDGNWSYFADDVKYILQHEELCCFVHFIDRYAAETFLAGGDLVCEDEDLWGRFYDAVEKKLSERKTRGYA